MKIFMVDLLCLTPFYDRYLIEALQKEGVDVELYATSFAYEPSYWQDAGLAIGQQVVDRIAPKHIRPAVLRRLLQVGEYIYNWRTLLKQAKKSRPDIVHIQWLPLLEKSAIELGFIREIQRLNIPVVYTCHNALPHESTQKSVLRYARLYKSVDHIIVHTRAEKQRLVSQLEVTEKKVSIVGHGPLFADLPVPSQARAKQALDHEGKVVLFMGIVRPYKGVHVLLRAWHAIESRHPDARLIVAGKSKPGYKRKLERYVSAQGISQRVCFLDRYLPVHSIPWLHAAADVVVLPYLHATQSGALLTACNFNAPVIATRTGGFAEIIDSESSGFLVAPDDEHELTRVLDRVLSASDEFRKSVAAALRCKVDRDLSWTNLASETIRVYRHLRMYASQSERT